MNRKDLCEQAHAYVLEALDEWARESGLPNLNGMGAVDGDLPALFADINRQVDRVIARSGLLIPDYPVEG